MEEKKPRRNPSKTAGAVPAGAAVRPYRDEAAKQESTAATSLPPPRAAPNLGYHSHVYSAPHANPRGDVTSSCEAPPFASRPRDKGIKLTALSGPEIIPAKQPWHGQHIQGKEIPPDRRDKLRVHEAMAGPETIPAYEPSWSGQRFQAKHFAPHQRDKRQEHEAPEIIQPKEPSHVNPLQPGYHIRGENASYDYNEAMNQVPRPRDEQAEPQLQHSAHEHSNEDINSDCGFRFLPNNPAPQNNPTVTLQGFTVPSQTHQQQQNVADSGQQNDLLSREQILRGAPLVEGIAVRKGTGSDEEVTGAKSKRSTSKMRCVAGIASFLIVVLIAVVVVVTVLFVIEKPDDLPSTKNAAEPNSTLFATSTQPPPTEGKPGSTNTTLLGPTQPSVEKKIYDVLKVLFETVSRKEDLENKSSPQHQALLWISGETSAPINDLEDRRTDLIQRYSLAAVYFSTGGPTSWAKALNFLSDKHVCDWNEAVPRYEPHNWTSKGAYCASGPHVVDVLKLPLNNLTGALPPELGLLSGLKNVTLYLNRLHGTIPSSLGNLADLRYISLSGNELTGEVPREISKAKKLTSLFLIKNKLSKFAPSKHFVLEHLTHLGLQENSLSGSLLFTEANFPKLQYLSLRENNLTGNADVLFSFKELAVLDCSFNKFSGTLPSDGGKGMSLLSLDMANNSFHGPLPEPIGKWSNLEFLQLVNNDFSSSLPTGLGALTRLTALTLGRNRLWGTLPDVLGDLSSLTALTLNDNEFTGYIPSSFSKLTSLDVLLLENNDLRGDINFMCNISIGLFGSDCQMAEVICDCCTHCCHNSQQGEHLCAVKSHGEDEQLGPFSDFPLQNSGGCGGAGLEGCDIAQGRTKLNSTQP